MAWNMKTFAVASLAGCCFVAMLLCMSLLPVAFATAQQRDSLASSDKRIILQRIHADVTSALFVTSVALAADVSIYRNPAHSFGMQLGVDFLDTPALMDKSEGTPFIDADVLGRFATTRDAAFSVELVAGYSWRLSLPDDVPFYPTSQLKYGGGVQWNITRIVSLHLRLRGVHNASSFHLSQIGLGCSVGWQP